MTTHLFLSFDSPDAFVNLEKLKPTRTAKQQHSYRQLYLPEINWEVDKIIGRWRLFSLCYLLVAVYAMVIKHVQ